ncbi:MAG: acetylglutamate kinase, partial [Clostridia bacterium]|nr:acetylglutamate kinase [Clostridia bacterium]
ELLTSGEDIPVVAPIGIDKEGQTYNINADTVASSIACAMKAEKLMMLTDIEGILDKEHNVIYSMTIDEAHAKIEDGTISGGMIPKVSGCIHAIESGVKRVHIIDGRVPHSILLEIFTDLGIGSMIKE